MSILTLWLGKQFSVKRLLRFLLPVCIPIGIWMVRNLIVLGAPLPVDTTGFQSDQPLEMSLIEFGRFYPVFSILMQTHWGLLGWMGDGTLQVRWLQIYSIYQQAFTWPVVLLLSLSLFFLFKGGFKERKCLAVSFMASLGGVILLFGSGWLAEEHGHYLPLFIIGSAVVGWSIGEFAYRVRNKNLDTTRFVEIGSLGVFLFFLSVHFYKIYSFSLTSGTLQGTFGRYYLPVIGCFMLGFFARGLRKFALAPQLVMIFAMIYSGVELYVWLHEAIPFFTVHD
jgi:hypothetical protein